MLPEELEARTERLFTGETVFTCAVAESWIDDRQITHGQSGHLAADGLDHTARVAAEYPRGRNRDPWQTTDDEQIEMVERGGAHADAHVAGANHVRHRQVIAELDAIQSAVTGNRECLH